MNAEASLSPSPDEIGRAAAHWVARRDRGLTAVEQDQLSTWLATDPRHGEMLAEQHWNWDELDRLAGVQTSLGAPPDPDLLAPEPSAKSAAWRRLRWFLPVTLAAAAAIVLAWRWRAPAPAAGVAAVLAPAMLQTPVERRVLADGSLVELSPGSEIAVAFSVTQRRVQVERGEATFTVARDPARPFVVHAGGVEVRAVGTIFNVRLDPDVVDVLVIEGRVMVERAAAIGIAAANGANGGPVPLAEPLLVEAGQRVLVPRTGRSPAQITTLTPAQLTAQRAGQPPRLEFNDATLAEVVAAFNRVSTIQLVIGDAELARMRVGGSFRSDDVAAFVRLLASTSDIVAERRNEREIVLRRAR